MNTEELISYIANAKKKTPVIVYIKAKKKLSFPKAKQFGGKDCIVIGEWEDIKEDLKRQENLILAQHVEASCRNSAVSLLDPLFLQARIEPGAIIREHVSLHPHTVVMMGAVINIGAIIKERTMIDMNAVIGARAQIGSDCHIGAGAVIAGALEPPSAQPVNIDHHVFIGANAVVLEGVQIAHHTVVAAGAVVTKDLPSHCVAAGCPARIIKKRNAQTEEKTKLAEELRSLK